LLATRIDRQQTEIRPFTAHFDVDTSAQLIAVFRYDESALCQMLFHFRLLDAITVDKEPFGDTERGVDDGRDTRGVSRNGQSNWGGDVGSAHKKIQIKPY
jgi:hypothetical protein